MKEDTAALTLAFCLELANLHACWVHNGGSKALASCPV